jgi:hypothetical protein
MAFESLFIISGVLVTIITNILYVKVMLKFEKRITDLENVVLIINNTQPNIQSPNLTEDTIASGLMKGFQQMREDEEKHLKLLEMSRIKNNTPLTVMNQNSTSKGFDTGGDLIPSNLTNEEQEILRIFYDRKNEQ